LAKKYRQHENCTTTWSLVFKICGSKNRSVAWEKSTDSMKIVQQHGPWCLKYVAVRTGVWLGEKVQTA
jgi:hypothetical protein